MTRGKLAVFVFFILLVGYNSGFVTRPLMMPGVSDWPIVTSASPIQTSSEARSVQYFAAHLAEARRVLADCRDGTVRGDECANAETAVITAESKDRFREFRGER